MKINRYIILLSFLVIVAIACKTEKSVEQINNPKTFLYIGSYTDGVEAEGIYVYEFNEETGALKEIMKQGEVINPSFLTISPNGKYLYSCTKSSMKINGDISAFKIDTLNGNLTYLNKQTTDGRNPVHLVVDKTNEYVLSANYTDAAVNLFKCREDGSLAPYTKKINLKGSSIVKGRQDKAHAHSVNLSPDNKYVFVPDLGSDRIQAFQFNAKSKLLKKDESLTIQTKAGSGPRHFAFHPSKPYAYGIEELSGSVTAYTYAAGVLAPIHSYFSYKEAQEKYASSDIHISPDGLYLYAANRKTENNIAIFSINQENGTLKLVGHESTRGEVPRNFAISPSGNHLLVANRKTDEVLVFKRDKSSGLLNKTPHKLTIKAPSCLKMRTYDQ